MKVEYQKITNLLDTTSDNVPRFINKKWIEVHDQSGTANDRYKPSKQIRFKNQCHNQIHVIAFILVKVTITVTRRNNRDRKNRSLAFKSNTPFIGCISKSNNVSIDNASNLDVVMPKYNLHQYCS